MQMYHAALTLLHSGASWFKHFEYIASDKYLVQRRTWQTRRTSTSSPPAGSPSAPCRAWARGTAAAPVTTENYQALHAQHTWHCRVHSGPRSAGLWFPAVSVASGYLGGPLGPNLCRPHQHNIHGTAGRIFVGVRQSAFPECTSYLCTLVARCARIFVARISTTSSRKRRSAAASGSSGGSVGDASRLLAAESALPSLPDVPPSPPAAMTALMPRSTCC
jgi:hypothetical protein